MPASKAQQKAVNKYMAKAYDRINLTVPKGQQSVIKAHSAARGESVNGFLNRAALETMERDNGLTHQEAATRPEQGAVSVPVSPEAYKAATEAASTSGEDLQTFVCRSIDTQAQRDKVSRRMEAITKKPPAET